jgi:hypothetical protein
LLDRLLVRMIQPIAFRNLPLRVGALALTTLLLPGCRKEPPPSVETYRISERVWDEIVYHNMLVTQSSARLLATDQDSSLRTVNAEDLCRKLTEYCRLLEPLFGACTDSERRWLSLSHNSVVLANRIIDTEMTRKEGLMSIDPLWDFERRLSVATIMLREAESSVVSAHLSERSQSLVAIIRDAALYSLKMFEVRYPESSKDHAAGVFNEKLDQLNAKAEKIFGADKWKPIKIEWVKD